MRLDILIYAHDGRGLGHVSRSVGIGMALKRLYPHLKILFISGSTFTGELLGNAPLDWLKLPSYKTEVVEGKSRGVAGNSMFSDRELGELRRRELGHALQLYRPRLVLADHTPQGKHKELLSALEAAPEDCQWVLGVRGVVGAVPQAKNSLARDLFTKSYSDLLWYGDSSILGYTHLKALKEQYGVEPFECGYVARLGEYLNCRGHGRRRERWAGVVSVPWIGENTGKFLRALAVSLENIGNGYGDWCLFIGGTGEERDSSIRNYFFGLGHCQLRVPDGSYGEELMQARSAIIYGGYNSLVDVLYADIPAIVVLRAMRDGEQQDHLRCLQARLKETLYTVSESEVNQEQLQTLLLQNLASEVFSGYRVKVDGAERAARYLYHKL